MTNARAMLWLFLIGGTECRLKLHLGFGIMLVPPSGGVKSLDRAGRVMAIIEMLFLDAGTSDELPAELPDTANPESSTS